MRDNQCYTRCWSHIEVFNKSGSIFSLDPARSQEGFGGSGSKRIGLKMSYNENLMDQAENGLKEG